MPRKSRRTSTSTTQGNDEDNPTSWYQTISSFYPTKYLEPKKGVMGKPKGYIKKLKVQLLGEKSPAQRHQEEAIRLASGVARCASWAGSGLSSVGGSVITTTAGVLGSAVDAFNQSSRASDDSRVTTDSVEKPMVAYRRSGDSVTSEKWRAAWHGDSGSDSDSSRWNILSRTRTAYHDRKERKLLEKESKKKSKIMRNMRRKGGSQTNTNSRSSLDGASSRRSSQFQVPVRRRSMFPSIVGDESYRCSNQSSLPGRYPSDDAWSNKSGRARSVFSHSGNVCQSRPASSSSIGSQRQSTASVRDSTSHRSHKPLARTSADPEIDPMTRWAMQKQQDG